MLIAEKMRAWKKAFTHTFDYSTQNTATLSCYLALELGHAFSSSLPELWHNIRLIIEAGA